MSKLNWRNEINGYNLLENVWKINNQFKQSSPIELLEIVPRTILLSLKKKSFIVQYFWAPDLFAFIEKSKWKGQVVQISTNDEKALNCIT